MDFSNKAIELARSMSRELGIEAEFVRSDIYDLPVALDGQYDIVFTSHGVLNWLPDFVSWAKVASHFVTPDGVFYMVEGHPIVDIFDADLRPHFPYFHSPEPFEYQPVGKGSYAAPDTALTRANYQWQHSVADIVNALISAGLGIEFLHEFPYYAYKELPVMEQSDDSWWRLPQGGNSIPLMFSLKTTKPPDQD